MLKNVVRTNLLILLISGQLHAATSQDFVNFNQEYTQDYFDFLRFKKVSIAVKLCFGLLRKNRVFLEFFSGSVGKQISPDL